MKKKVGIIVAAGVIAMSPFLIKTGNTETLDSIQEKKNKVEKQKDAAEKQISEIDEQTMNLKTEIEELDKSIMEMKKDIEQKESEIEQQRKEIAKLQEGNETLNKQIAQRTEVLRNRIVSHQETGGVDFFYLQALTGAQGISDFISRVSAINEIMDADREIIEQLEHDLRLVEQQEQVESEKQAEYEKQLEELKELEDSLNKKNDEKENALEELESQAQIVLEELQELEREEEFLKEQEAALIKAAEEAARKAKEEEGRQNAQNHQSNTREQSDNSGENLPEITDDLFMRPAMGPLTSEFGMRTLNGRTRFHYGIDIGKRGENVPIVAAADGVVIRADYSTSYGNVVFITHNLEGEVYTTVYAHLERLSVESGEIVTKGQELGPMGNTGFSFGAHLHFELHEGEWNIQKSNAVNPREYIDFDELNES